ncbi:hypothetical protein [Catellatospora methionotrophica]|uniref:hypothetical protein n=1 Tax=Catellatospora methionotrophica TaxID=121620 RepID=UPI0033F9F869
MASEVQHMLLRLSAEQDFHQRLRILHRIAKSPNAGAVLREIRRHGPGRLRTAALDVLAYRDGESGLDPVDVAAVERLIRIHRRTDPLGGVMSIDMTWWCVRSMDQSAVLASLGLDGPRPVTYRLANSVMEIVDSDDECGLVYVGPKIDGWTSIVGPWCDAFGARAEENRTIIERLSAECGEVHAFHFSAYNDGTAWLVARDGVTTRRFNTFDLADATGDPLPVEQDWMATHGVPGRPEEHLTYNEHGSLVCLDEFEDAMWEFYEANDVAAAISVDVGWKRPTNAVVHGSPVLAATPGAGPVMLPPGMYRI